jgi:peptidoglycan-associated lipoprotein
MRRGSLLIVIVAASMIIGYGCTPKQISTPFSERVDRRPLQGTDRSSRDDVPLPERERRPAGIIEEDLTAKPAEGGQKNDNVDARINQLEPRLRDIYFAFDAYSLRPEDLSTLKNIAEWLHANPRTKLNIEGHCDERGTTDYNLALGQKRAEAAKEYLLKMGIGAKRIKALSFGKETPIDQGHSEDAWTKNRRVHFVAQ